MGITNHRLSLFCDHKVLIAQERMSNNHVYCFKKKDDHKYQWVVECRSQTSGGRPVSTIYMQMYRRITKGGDRQVGVPAPSSYTLIASARALPCKAAMVDEMPWPLVPNAFPNDDCCVVGGGQ